MGNSERIVKRLNVNFYIYTGMNNKRCVHAYISMYSHMVRSYEETSMYHIVCKVSQFSII
ncbi:hypothetical protein R51_35410 [Bacillus safensis]|nr:hypothetical protein R51_35410 [Bacillus safensis]